MFARQAKRGFTLVEILIVVIILGILAAIVIPQFTNASQDARKSSLVSQLQTLRSQIELYKLQHGDTLPTLATDWTPLTTVTTYNGTNFGPYMQAIPKNPLNNLSTVANTASLTTPAAGTGVGFMYNYTTTVAGDGTGRIWGTSDAAGLVIYVE